MSSKQCLKCETAKPLVEFSRQVNTEDGLSRICRQCKAEYDRIHNQKPKTKARRRKHRRTEVMISWHKNYRKEYIKRPGVRKKMHQSSLKNMMKRLKTDLKFRLNFNIGHLIRYHLHKRGSSKNGQRWKDLVGYSLDKLMDRMEKLWQPGMTWKNYGRGQGKWQIDHIVPVNAFNFSSANDIDFRRCWALSNLQPLWAEDNLKKRDKLDKPFQPNFKLRIKK